MGVAAQGASETGGREVVAGVAAFAAWLALVGLLVLVSRLRRIAPGPETTELRGEPPAVAGLLAGGFCVPDDAPSAVLLDLAARRYVDIDDVGDGRVVCRIRNGGRGDLEAHEGHVLEHVRGLAVDGVVPAAALTTGDAEDSGRWLERFGHHVTADAQRRGLCTPFWTKPLLTALTVAAAVAAAVAWVASDFVAGAALCVGLAGLGVVGVLSRSSRQRPTDAGRVAAAHWLGVRRYLRGSRALEDDGPAAVAIWDRLLAYGAALGEAPAAAGALPLGPEDDKLAWSAVGGRWRRVRVRYPRRRPGWGRPPLLALVIAAPFLLLGGLLLWAAWLVASTDAPAALLAVLLLPFALGGLLVAVGARLAGRAVTDLRAAEEVRGRVIRCRSFQAGEDRWEHYVAVDDGSSSHVDAWYVGAAVYRTVDQGDDVVATVTPHLRCVRAVRPADT